MLCLFPNRVEDMSSLWNGDGDDDSNLAEIQAAIEQAEVENFLTSQGINDVDERNELVYEMLKVRPGLLSRGMSIHLSPTLKCTLLH